MDDLRQAVAVFVTLVGLAAALYWLRRKGFARFSVGLPKAGPTRQLRAIDRLSLTPQHSLHLVQVGGRTVLVAASPGGCSILEGVSLERSPEA